MPGVSQIVFGARCLERKDVEGKRILDVGGRDYNGSIRPLLESWKPEAYVGIDIDPGPGVDLVCPAEEILSRFGAESFDIVVCLEMLEHAPTWKRAVREMKLACRSGGKILLTTRSLGYPVHGFPHDFWRFEVDDLRAAFSDFIVLAAEGDPVQPGAFIFAERPAQLVEGDLSGLAVWSIPLGARSVDLPADYRDHRSYRRLAVKERVKRAGEFVYRACGRAYVAVTGAR